MGKLYSMGEIQGRARGKSAMIHGKYAPSAPYITAM